MKLDLAGLVNAASSAFTTLSGAPAGASTRVAETVGPWVQSFLRSAATHWVPYLTSGRACAVPVAQTGAPCLKNPIAPCSACERPCCLDHAAVDQYGGAICYLCVREIMVRKRFVREAPPSGSSSDRQPHVPPEAQEERIKVALKTLGLRRGSSWQEIKQRHKKLLAEHHPDRKRTEASKARAEERFKAVQSAYLDLERFYPKEQAA